MKLIRSVTNVTMISNNNNNVDVAEASLPLSVRQLVAGHQQSASRLPAALSSLCLDSRPPASNQYPVRVHCKPPYLRRSVCHPLSLTWPVHSSLLIVDGLCVSGASWKCRKVLYLFSYSLERCSTHCLVFNLLTGYVCLHNLSLYCTVLQCFYYYDCLLTCLFLQRSSRKRSTYAVENEFPFVFYNFHTNIHLNGLLTKIFHLSGQTVKLYMFVIVFGRCRQFVSTFVNFTALMIK